MDPNRSSSSPVRRPLRNNSSDTPATTGTPNSRVSTMNRNYNNNNTDDSLYYSSNTCNNIADTDNENATTTSNESMEQYYTYNSDENEQQHHNQQQEQGMESDEYASSYSPIPSPSPSPPNSTPIVTNKSSTLAKGLHHRHPRNRGRNNGSTTGTTDYYSNALLDNTTANGTTNSDQKKKRRGNGWKPTTTNRWLIFTPSWLSKLIGMSTHIPNHQRAGPRKQFLHPFGRYIQSCVIIAVPAYFVGFVFFLYTTRNANIALKERNSNNDYRSELLYDHNGNEFDYEQTGTKIVTLLAPEYYQTVHEIMLSTNNQRQEKQQQRNQDEIRIIQQSQQQFDETAVGRRARTRPNASLLLDDASSSSSLNMLDRYSIMSSLDYDYAIPEESPASNNAKSSSKRKDDKPASLESLCGYHAQSAALKTPSSFLYKDALVKTSSSKVRVLITGILSTPVGYRLAQVLKQQCGVSVMIGFDSLYPNSFLNRLFYQEQMAILTKMTPKLVKPFFTGHVGLDPLKHAKNFETLPATTELDIVQTFQPTHIVHLANHNSDHSYQKDDLAINDQSPYAHIRHTCPSDDDDSEFDSQSSKSTNPPLFPIKNSMVAMEQILASIANTPPDDRPHFIYASASTPLSPSSIDESNKQCTLHSNKADSIVHNKARRIDEVMADYYNRQYGVYSIGLRLPLGVYGSWDHTSSPIHQVIRQEVSHAIKDSSGNDQTIINSTIPIRNLQNEFDMIYVDDAVDAIISAMQFRPITDSSPGNQAMILELSSGTTRTIRDVQRTSRELLKLATSKQGTTSVAKLDDLDIPDAQYDGTGSERYRRNVARVKDVLGWTPKVSLLHGIAQSVAWHFDRLQPYGPPPPNTPSYMKANMTKSVISKEKFLQKVSLPYCANDDVLCHSGHPVFPCASECAMHKTNECIPTIFDDLIPLSQELSQECDIVLYTQLFDRNATDLELSAEFMAEGNPIVCNFAYINQESKLTNAVLEKVPDEELKNLDFHLTPEDMGRPGSIRKRKFEALNGRLLYRGWILVWAKNVPDLLTTYENFLLKLSPGRFFSKDVKQAVFIEQNFRVSPKADDIAFLAHEMKRDYLEPRMIKRKHRPKAKFLLPPEPERQAVILLPQLKFQDSPDAQRLPPDEKISVYEATRFMRFEIGEKTPLDKEPTDIKRQREFYERIKGYVNPDYARNPNEPTHKFELNKWVRTRWVAHDLTNDDGRVQVRCPWYQEQILWNTTIDQLSLAYVLERLDLVRKFEHNEPDDSVQKLISEKTGMKRMLSDTFEWIPLQTDLNRQYSSYEEMQMLPYDFEYVTEEKKQQLWPRKDNEESHYGNQPFLFARIISDRIMALARQEWNAEKKHNPKHTKQKHKKK